ncbi:MAG: PD-(D/E)XK nuclease family protein [Acidobacteriota bacterium]|nr:PD-(D/E)XK nuclease family protein [Acidobacteriota bacterium]
MRLAFTGLSSWFEENATIVTPSPILSAIASQEFSQSQLQHGRESWRRPVILSVDAWLTTCWQEARYSDPSIPPVLSTSQEHLVWQTIIERENPGLFDINATARLARRAATLVAEWNIPLEGESWTDNQDAQQFLVWFKQFRSKCLEENWIARRDLWKLLPQWVADVPTAFVGFDHLSPGLKRIHEALTKSAVFGTAGEFSSPAVPLTLCESFKSEVEHAARWARALFEEQPTRSIAVFVPELSTRRALIERTFHKVFYSGLAFHFEAPSSDSVFHVSAAQPLAEHPLITGALLLLDLARARIGHANAAAILRSPFISGAAEELNARALADLSLRRRRELDVTLRDIEYASRSCPVLVSIWPKLRGVLRDKPHKAELAGWGEFIGDLLQSVGWPGDVELTSQEQEAVEDWKNAVSALGALGMVSAPVSFETALSHLRRVLSGNGLERGDWFSPVQILDASEAAGLNFDCAFLVGLSDETWPPPLRLSALIPLTLQRAHGIPGSEPRSLQVERERLTKSLLVSAPVLAGSYSGRLSPFVQSMVRNSRKELPLWKGNLPVQSFAPVALDEVEDKNAPAFDLTHGTRGGTSIIKAQSLCPFRAFAEIRLRAQTPEDACFGFDARDRGGFLHKALQYVWQDLKTQARLKLMPEADLQRIVHEAAARAVSEQPDSAFYEQSTLIERERLEELILDWLTDVEKQRLQPFTVESVEDALEYNLAGLPLRLRIDRMDRLKNGQLVLIDYKSGAQTKNKLNCPRPSEPQLLVYAAAKGSEVDGILFGQLRARELRLVGISREKHFKGTSIAVHNDKWDDVTEASRKEVERLARDFLRGDALVDPVKGACEYCDIKPLCRISEKTGQEREAD